MFVKEITKRYDGKAVVDGVSFEIPKGKVLSLIGPNGAGKSTVMGMLSRLIARDSGLVDFEGTEITRWKSRELSKRLAILTQANNVQMKLTVRELVAFGRCECSGCSRRLRRFLLHGKLRGILCGCIQRSRSLFGSGAGVCDHQGVQRCKRTGR